MKRIKADKVSYFAKDYIPATQSFMDGFLGPKGNVGFSMVFDIKKAEGILNQLNQQGRSIERAMVGLDGDWGENSVELYPDNCSYDFYQHSIWAKPIMIVEFKDGPSEAYEVWSKNLEIID